MRFHIEYSCNSINRSIEKMEAEYIFFFSKISMQFIQVHKLQLLYSLLSFTSLLSVFFSKISPVLSQLPFHTMLEVAFQKGIKSESQSQPFKKQTHIIAKNSWWRCLQQMLAQYFVSNYLDTRETVMKKGHNLYH